MGKAQSKSHIERFEVLPMLKHLSACFRNKTLGLYRKRDGPEGECFVVNAHFNPLAVADFEDTCVKPPKCTASEITFSVSNCTKDDDATAAARRRAGFADDKYPLKVVLPPESCGTSDTSCIKEEIETKSESSEEKKDIAFQSFECDVSVEADVKGNEKQEFLFTLYDLDGYGKITKDDLASLVRGIYEAMGSSLKLSPSGSKTIRVRLTIAPDRKTADGVKLTKKTKKKKGRKRPEGSENEAKRDFEDDKEHDGQNRGEEEDEEKRTIPGMESEDEDREGDDEEDEDEDEEGGEDDEDKELCPAPAVTEYSKAAEVTTLAGGGRRSHHHHHHHHQQRQESRHLSNPLPVKSALDSQYSHRSPNWIAEEKTQKSPQLGTSPSLGRKRNRVSFSSPSKLLQKTQLLEIIQANLEKNSFGNYVETSKNRYGDGTTGGGCEERLKRHHHRSWIHGGKWNFREGQSHYLDLAGIENYSSLNNRNGVEEADGCPAVHGEGQCPYHVIPDAATTHPKQSWECGHHACHTNRSRNQRHHRSRSHDLADPTCGYFRYRLLADGGETTAPQSSTRVRTEEEEEGLLSSCKFPGGGGEKGDWQNGRHHHHHHHHSHGGGGGGGVSGHHRRERDLHAALYHARSKSYDAYYCEQATTTTPASFSPKLKEHISKRGGATGSPHHHKHRHRERDHQRAMQQVASWIEKEHLGFGGCNLMSKGAAPEQASATGGHQQQQNNHHYCSQQHHIPPPPPPPPPPPHVLHNQRPSSPRTSEKASFLVERHEHHHVHEHFHHHYHHYHEL